MALHINITDEIIKICDECGSEYYEHHSKMESLCPNCAHDIYGYKNCPHKIENSKCKICGCDGSISPFITQLKNNI